VLGLLTDHRFLWRRRGIGRDRIFAESKLYEPLGSTEAILEQSKQRFSRTCRSVEKQLRAAT
jgi:hypothetical protein